MYYSYDRQRLFEFPSLYFPGVFGFTDARSFVALRNDLPYEQWLKTLEHEKLHFHYRSESRVRELAR